MTIREKLQKAWDNRASIADGFFHAYISCSPELEQEAQRRLAICKANTCGYWDETGTSDKLVEQGKPGCTGCGCEGMKKTHCFSCHCYLKDIGQEPLWDSVVTSEQENTANQKIWEQQFKK